MLFRGSGASVSTVTGGQCMATAQDEPRRWSSARHRLLSSWRWPSFGGALEIGLSRALHIREERLSTRHDAYRLLYVSDIHLRKSRSDVLCGQVLDSITRCNPDVVLLGGDLVDHPSE